MAKDTPLIGISPAPSYFDRIFLHEICMGLLMIQILIRLIIAGAPAMLVVLYLLCLASYVFLIRQGRKTLSSLSNRIRLISNIVLMNILFTSIKTVIPALGRQPLDHYLYGIDHLILGRDLSVWAQLLYCKPLTEIMSIGYMLFIIFLFLTFVYYGFRADLDKLCRFCSGIFILYAVGISGYSIVPAQGPYVYLAGAYTRALEGYFFTDLNNLMVRLGSAGYDVFPSLHVGVGLFLLMFYRKYDRWLFKIYLVPFIVLAVSTIYLRYHYVIDLVAGASLALVCFALGETVFQRISMCQLPVQEDHACSEIIS